MNDTRHTHVQKGALDGMTLFRFAHVFRDERSGGMERYLGDLNRRLLERNDLRIVQMYLAAPQQRPQVEVRRVGRGEIVWMPSYVRGDSGSSAGMLDGLVNRIRRKLAPQDIVNHDLLLENLDSYAIDLAAFHWLSADSIPVLRRFRARRTPVVVINHFPNERLARRSAREHIAWASGVAGVSSVDIPRSLANGFTNLSDGVDTDFFNPARAAPQVMRPGKPLILLPARVVEGKGHIDAIKVISWLKRHEVSASLAFAGRVEDNGLMRRIENAVRSEGLDDDVIFLGSLESERLRDWYAAAAFVLLASSYEGLGRVLLEAQSMERPVLAYAVGGIPEALRDGEGGFLVRAGDIEALGLRSMELLVHEEKRHAMGKRARQFVVERFTIQHLVERHEVFCEQAIGIPRC